MIKINKKWEWEILIVIGLFLVLFFVSLESIILVYPMDTNKIFDRNPELEWKGNYDYYDIILSKNSDLSQPIINKRVYGNTYLIRNKLEFGDYYWKIMGYKDNKIAESIIKQFSIVPFVALTDFRNSGNTQLRINNELTGAVILDVNEELKEIPENSLLKAEQNEK